MKSPFETLGILPYLVSQLNEEQLKIVTKESGRALQIIFHPDKLGGDTLRTALINGAIGSLSSVSSIKDAREEYVLEGPGQREVSEAESELLTLQYRLAALKENIRKTKLAIETENLGLDVDETRTWIETLYSDSLGSMEPGGESGYEPALHLRHAPGIRFRLEIGAGSLERIRSTDGRIDENGYILIDNRETGLRAMGSAPFFEMDNTDGDFLWRPLLVKGDCLLGSDDTGRIRFVGILEGFERSLEDRIRKGEILGRRKTGEPPALEEEEGTGEKKGHTTETGLTLRQEMKVEYEKNPFEALGIIPALVMELSSDDLKNLVHYISKSLQKLYHPDSGGDSFKFTELMKAVVALENPDIFKRAKREYSIMKPGEARRQEIEKRSERVRQEIIDLVPELARLKAESARAEERARIGREAGERFHSLLMRDLISVQSRGTLQDVLFLHQSAGSTVFVSTGKGIAAYKLQTTGFDVFAVSKRTRMRLIGSVPPGKFTDLEHARESVDSLALTDVYLHVQPVLYPNGYLVKVQNDTPEIVGMVESIEEGRKVARKMERKLLQTQVAKPKQIRKR